MNKAIIDIGSNSVRIRLSSGGKVLLRKKITTQLASDRGSDGKLCYKSIIRTLDGVKELKRAAEEFGECSFDAFATAAVRRAPDGQDFCSLVFNETGIAVRVLSGEEEAELGITGALKGGDGAVIDVGGASTEIVVAEKRRIIYGRSVDFGAVILSENCERSFEKTLEFLQKEVKKYGELPKVERVYGIGGTANTLAFIGCGLPEYDRDKQNGYYLSKEEALLRAKELFSLETERIVQKYGIDLKRASVLPFGAAAFYACLCAIGAEGATLSEEDNLDGYYLLSEGVNAYEK